MFVTDRIALTANHNVVGVERVSVSNALGRTFVLAVVTRLVDLDVAVLRATCLDDLAQSQLSLPAQLDLRSMLRKSVTLVHGNIAWSNEHRPAAVRGRGAAVGPQRPLHNICTNNGYIVSYSDTYIFSDVCTFKGDSGASLLFRGSQIIGLHVIGFNDLDASESEKTPSTAAESVRLDLPIIRNAVSAAHAAWDPLVQVNPAGMAVGQAQVLVARGQRTRGASGGKRK